MHHKIGTPRKTNEWLTGKSPSPFLTQPSWTLKKKSERYFPY